jgi:hypothetical protein
MKRLMILLTGIAMSEALAAQSVTQATQKSAPQGMAPDQNLACFDNKYIRGCTRAYLNKDKKSISVAAVLRNHSAKTVLIGLLTTCRFDYNNGCNQDRSDKPEYSFPNAELLTDGKALRASMTRGASAYFRRWVDRDKIDINNMTVLDPGGKITITYYFASKETINSMMYDFTSEAVMYVPTESDKKKYSKRKFTISGTDVYFPIQ